MTAPARWILALFVFGIGALWLLSDDKISSVHSYVQNGDLLTLELQVTADQILDAHKNDLTRNAERTVQPPALYFHPLLLLDAKYYDKNQKTKQGSLLFSLMDGEMILNTDTWETTRGFEDTLNANTSPQEFKVLNFLAANKGTASKEKIQKDLNLEPHAASAFIDNLKYKQLVITRGNDVILHFDNPHFDIAPQTKMKSELVIKPYQQGKKIQARYSKSKVERNAKAAFGNDFTIRDSKEIYLPVWRFSLLNPDGSTLITEWNGVTGEKMNSKGTLRLQR